MAKRKAKTVKAKSSRKPSRHVRATARGKRTATKSAARGRTAPRAVAKRTARPRRKTAAAGGSQKRSVRAAAPSSSRRRPAPGLQRQRRTLEETIPTPPSSLDLDRHASAARTGRAAILEHLHEHTETSPALTAGDVDADWERAYDSGDEAPGGDNPTPDQDIVDDIGKALGIQYEDAEELKGADKVAKRDQHRWELDPASSEDYPERGKR